MVVRLQDIWQVLPDNHQLLLRVKPMNSRDFYYDRGVKDASYHCPYHRRLCKVISVYALTKETIEITIEETLPERG